MRTRKTVTSGFQVFCGFCATAALWILPSISAAHVPLGPAIYFSGAASKLAADIDDNARQLSDSESLALSLNPSDSHIRFRFADSFVFSGQQGQRMVAEMRTEDFRPVLQVRQPDGTRLEFDAVDGAPRIDMELPQDGEYLLICSTQDRRETGDYELQFDLDPGSAREEPAADEADGERPVSVDVSDRGVPNRPRGGSNRPEDDRERPREEDEAADPDRSRGENPNLFGVFVGIENYRRSDSLENCDKDAADLYDIFRNEYGMPSAHGRRLLNQDATASGIRDAILEIGAMAGPDDLLFFFYSGHGDRYEDDSDAFDPDGVHESLSVYDGSRGDSTITDDELADWINQSQAGRCIVALDACFSGGFSKDVVSVRGRMGLFSSEEYVTSLVATQFQAGGFLSIFLADALSLERDVADLNGDQALTAFELKQYIQDRFRTDVVSGGGGPKLDSISPDDDTLHYQVFVPDLGGLPFNEVLFEWGVTRDRPSRRSPK